MNGICLKPSEQTRVLRQKKSKTTEFSNKIVGTQHLSISVVRGERRRLYDVHVGCDWRWKNFGAHSMSKMQNTSAILKIKSQIASISGRHAKGWSRARISTEMEEEEVEIQTRRSEGWVEFLKLCYFTWKKSPDFQPISKFKPWIRL